MTTSLFRQKNTRPNAVIRKLMKIFGALGKRF